jgi:hypothetical protein
MTDGDTSRSWYKSEEKEKTWEKRQMRIVPEIEKRKEKEKSKTMFAFAHPHKKTMSS